MAAAVAESSATDPPKSSLQCRHKIEKLRKRYRAEKQRCLNYPGRFFSSWNLFPLLDSMEIGSVGSKQEPDADKANDIGDGFRVKTLGDRYLVTPRKYDNIDRDLEDPDMDLDLDPDLAFRARKYSKIEGDFSNTFDFDHDLGTGVRVKPIGDRHSVSVAFMPKNYGKIKANVDLDCNYGGGFGLKIEKTQVDSNLLPRGVRLKGYGKCIDDYSSPNYRNAGEGVDTYGGFPVKTLGDRNLVTPGFKPKSHKMIDRMYSPTFAGDDDDGGVNYRSDKRDRFGKKCIDNWSSAPSGFRPKSCSNADASLKPDVDSGALNGYGNAEINGIRGAERGMDPIEQLVSAIKLSTESFVKVEKMKMEMAMEIEKMKMEMELKHNQMILESQQQIVDAFAKALLEKKKKKKQAGVLSTISKRNGDSQVAATDSESIGKSSIVKEEGEGCLT